MLERVNKTVFIALIVMLLFCGVLGCTESKKSAISSGFTNPDGSESNYKNSISMEFVKIPASEFMMGLPSDEAGKSNVSGPIHKVMIEDPFYIGKFEVTQKQWIKIMDSNPSFFKGDDLPAENVSWDDIQKFIKKLNEKEGTNKYRLPSEAEWEYTCRAGTTTKYYFGNNDSELKDYCWYSGYIAREEWMQHTDKLNNGSTHPVGQKEANLWGLYDMHGNVWEWCQDRWHDSYGGAPSDGSAWEIGNSSERVLRGGSWFSHAGDCQSAPRFKSSANFRNRNIGFRVVREI